MRGPAGVPGQASLDNPALIDHCHLVVGGPSLWLYGVGWAVLAIVIGFFVFWRAEVTYGRG